MSRVECAQDREFWHLWQNRFSRCSPRRGSESRYCDIWYQNIVSSSSLAVKLLNYINQKKVVLQLIHILRPRSEPVSESTQKLVNHFQRWVLFAFGDDAADAFYFMENEDGVRFIDRVLSHEATRMEYAKILITKLAALVLLSKNTFPVMRLIQEFKLLDLKDASGNSPLHLLAPNFYNNIYVAGMTFFELGRIKPDILSMQNNKGKTVLHNHAVLIQRNITERVNFFFTVHGLDPQCLLIKDKNGNSVLHRAVRFYDNGYYGTYYSINHKYPHCLGNALGIVLRVSRAVGPHALFVENNSGKTPLAILVEQMNLVEKKYRWLPRARRYYLEQEVQSFYKALTKNDQAVLLSHPDGRCLILKMASFLQRNQLAVLSAELDGQSDLFSIENRLEAKIAHDEVCDERRRLEEGCYGVLALNATITGIARIAFYANISMISDDQMISVMSTRLKCELLPHLPIIALLELWPEMARSFQSYIELLCSDALFSELCDRFADVYKKTYVLRTFLDSTKEVIQKLNISMNEFVKIMKGQVLTYTGDDDSSSYFTKWLVSASPESVYDFWNQALLKEKPLAQQLQENTLGWPGVDFSDAAQFYTASSFEFDYSSKWTQILKSQAHKQFKSHPFYGLTLVACIRPSSTRDALARFRKHVDRVFVKCPKTFYEHDLNKKGLAIWFFEYASLRASALRGYFENVEFVNKKVAVAKKIARALASGNALSLTDEEREIVLDGNTLKVLYNALLKVMPLEITELGSQVDLAFDAVSAKDDAEGSAESKDDAEGSAESKGTDAESDCDSRSSSEPDNNSPARLAIDAVAMNSEKTPEDTGSEHGEGAFASVGIEMSNINRHRFLAVPAGESKAQDGQSAACGAGGTTPSIK